MAHSWSTQCPRMCLCSVYVCLHACTDIHLSKADSVWVGSAKIASEGKPPFWAVWKLRFSRRTNVVERDFPLASRILWPTQTQTALHGARVIHASPDNAAVGPSWHATWWREADSPFRVSNGWQESLWEFGCSRCPTTHWYRSSAVSYMYVCMYVLKMSRSSFIPKLCSIVHTYVCMYVLKMSYISLIPKLCSITNTYHTYICIYVRSDARNDPQSIDAEALQYATCVCTYSCMYICAMWKICICIISCAKESHLEVCILKMSQTWLISTKMLL